MDGATFAAGDTFTLTLTIEDPCFEANGLVYTWGSPPAQYNMWSLNDVDSVF
jgi:hypothetical protein